MPTIQTIKYVGLVPGMRQVLVSAGQLLFGTPALTTVLKQQIELGGTEMACEGASMFWPSGHLGTAFSDGGTLFLSLSRGFWEGVHCSATGTIETITAEKTTLMDTWPVELDITVSSHATEAPSASKTLTFTAV